MVAADAAVMHKSLLIPYLIFQLFSIKIRIVSEYCVFFRKNYKVNLIPTGMVKLKGLSVRMVLMSLPVSK